MKRMESTERGKTMRTMGVRGAVEVWRATVELEGMVGRDSEGDEMDVDAEGDTDEECDPFEDVEIRVESKGEGKEGKVKEDVRGTLVLSQSWVVVPGEDWEMVDCAA